jgi:putative ABC transport system permease protein
LPYPNPDQLVVVWSKVPSHSDVLSLMLNEGIVLATIGLGIGLAGSALVGRAMRSMLYGVGVVDFTAFASVAMILFFAGLLACYIPARRAARVDPMVALRYE